jgi:hypothetical protein
LDDSNDSQPCRAKLLKTEIKKNGNHILTEEVHEDESNTVDSDVVSGEHNVHLNQDSNDDDYDEDEDNSVEGDVVGPGAFVEEEYDDDESGDDEDDDEEEDEEDDDDDE